MSNYKDDENFIKLISKFDFGKGPWMYVEVEIIEDEEYMLNIITFDKEKIIQNIYDFIIKYNLKKDENDNDYEYSESKDYKFDLYVRANDDEELYVSGYKYSDYRFFISIKKINLNELTLNST